MKNNMVKKQNWEAFRSTGLLLFINQILHVFGWAIVYEFEGEEIKNIYPARVHFRGFDNESVGYAYEQIAEYLKNNAVELYKEATEIKESKD